MQIWSFWNFILWQETKPIFAAIAMFIFLHDIQGRRVLRLSLTHTKTSKGNMNVWMKMCSICSDVTTEWLLSHFQWQVGFKGRAGVEGAGGLNNKEQKMKTPNAFAKYSRVIRAKKINIYDEECREFMSLSSLRHSCLLSPHAHTKRWTDYLLCCAVKTAKCHRSSAVKAQVAYCSLRSRHFRVWLEGTLSHLALKIRSIPGTFSGLRFILLEFRKGRYRILKDK